MHAADDGLEIKTDQAGDEVHGVRFENCIGWCDEEAAMWLTHEISSVVSDVVFHDITVMHYDYKPSIKFEVPHRGALTILPALGGNVRNVSFEHITNEAHDSQFPVIFLYNGICARQEGGSTLTGSIVLSKIVNYHNMLFAPLRAISLFFLLGLLPAYGGPFAVMQKSPGMSVSVSEQGSVSFSSQQVGRGIAGQTLDLRAAPGERIQLKVVVEKSDLKDKNGASSPNLELPNGEGKGLCLSLTQYSAGGETLNTVNSLPMLSVNAAKDLTLEAFILQGAASYKVQIRAVDISGEAVVGRFECRVLPALPAPDFARSWVQRNPKGSLEWFLLGKPRPLNLYFGNNQFGRDERILSEVNKAVVAGVSAISFGLPLAGQASNEEILATLSRFLSGTGDTPFFLRVWMGPPNGWLASHPREMFRYEDGTTEGYVAPSSEPWRRLVAESLDNLFRLISSSPYGKRFAGILPLYYQTGEWILWNPDKQGGFDDATRETYKAWLQSKYASMEALNAAWKTNETGWDAATQPPSREERTKSGFGILRTAGEQRAKDWAVFYSTLVPGAIDAVGKTIKQASAGKLLVGVFYGYTVELGYSDIWPQQSGHLGLGQVLESPNIDFLGSPYSYNQNSRAFGLPLNFMSEVDSPALHGKLYFPEEDTFTHLADKPDPKLLAPGYAERTHNETETLAVLSRDAGTFISHGLILHWQSLLSDGRFDSPSIWKSYGALFPWTLAWEQARAPYQPQIACVIDEQAYFSLSLESKAFYQRWLYTLQVSLSRLGAPVGIYLQSDLAKIPKSVRCLILPTSFTMGNAEMEILRRDWLKEGRMAIFCWLPPGAMAGKAGAIIQTIPGLPVVVHGEALDLASKMQGDLWSGCGEKPFSVAADPQRFHGRRFEPIAPYATVPPGSGRLLASYTANGQGSCAWYQGNGFSTAFLGALVTSPAQWRALLVKAGCHFYLEPKADDASAPDFVQGSGPFLSIQSGCDGQRTIAWPRPCMRIFHWNGVAWQQVGTSAQKLDWSFKRGIPEFFLAE